MEETHVKLPRGSLRIAVCARAGGGRGRLGPVSAGRGRAERLRSFGRETWAPYLADTLLRVFASASVSGQLGRFTRPFLDYTAGSVRPSPFLVSLWGSGEHSGPAVSFVDKEFWADISSGLKSGSGTRYSLAVYFSKYFVQI